MTCSDTAVCVDQRLADENDRERAGREKRPERNVLPAATTAEGDERDPDDRAGREPGEDPEEHVPPTQVAEEAPEQEREAHVAEPEAARRDHVE